MLCLNFIPTVTCGVSKNSLGLRNVNVFGWYNRKQHNQAVNRNARSCIN